jgi:hypothetical protein
LIIFGPPARVNLDAGRGAFTVFLPACAPGEDKPDTLIGTVGTFEAGLPAFDDAAAILMAVADTSAE